jgi:hypothetical protein
MPNPLKRKNSDVASVVSDALAFIDKVAEFYAKYHILEYEDRTHLLTRLKTTRQTWARCDRVEQAHIDLVVAMITNLRAHFEEWLQHPLVARKRWHKHPGGGSINRLISKAETTTLLPQEIILQESRKLSAVEADMTAWS